MNKATEELRDGIAKIELKPFHLHSWITDKDTLASHTHLTPRGVDETLKLLKDMGYKRVVGMRLPDYRYELEEIDIE